MLVLYHEVIIRFNANCVWIPEHQNVNLRGRTSTSCGVRRDGPCNVDDNASKERITNCLPVLPLLTPCGLFVL